MKKLFLMIGCFLTLTTTNSLLADSPKNISIHSNATSFPGRDDCSKSEKAAEDAYNKARQSEDSENFEDIRKYAAEAMDAFEDSKKAAGKCGCDKAEDEAGKGYKHAKKASKAENLKDAKEYASDARKNADDLRSFARGCSRN